MQVLENPNEGINVFHLFFRMLQVGYVHNKGDFGLLICVFSQPVHKQYVPQIKVDGADSEETLLWYTPSSESFSNVWVSDYITDTSVSFSKFIFSPRACRNAHSIGVLSLFLFPSTLCRHYEVHTSSQFTHKHPYVHCINVSASKNFSLL